MKHTAFLLALMLLLSLTASAMGKKKLKRTMDSWKGSTKHSLVMSWGPPARTTNDGSNGEILIYYSTSSWYATTYYHYRMFYVNSDGKIYHWMTSTESVPPQQLNLNVYHY